MYMPFLKLPIINQWFNENIMLMQRFPLYDVDKLHSIDQASGLKVKKYAQIRN